MKNRWALRLAALTLVSCLAMSGVSLAVEPGSATDPLVTLSYLNDVFLGQIMTKVDQKITARNSQLLQQSGGAGGISGVEFAVVTISKGQILTGDIGCEVMLRVGTASCVSPSNPGLIDETTAASLNNGGALAANHLYMMTIEGRGVKAGSDTTKLLVRGSYTVHKLMHRRFFCREVAAYGQVSGFSGRAGGGGTDRHPGDIVYGLFRLLPGAGGAVVRVGGGGDRESPYRCSGTGERLPANPPPVFQTVDRPVGTHPPGRTAPFRRGAGALGTAETGTAEKSIPPLPLGRAFRCADLPAGAGPSHRRPTG